LFIPASRAEILELSLVDRQDRVFLAVQKSLAQHPDQGNSTAGMGTEATLGLRPISSVTLYRIAQYKIPLAFNALYFPYSETTHLFGVNSTD
jgi:hypothetical protein